MSIAQPVKEIRNGTTVIWKQEWNKASWTKKDTTTVIIKLGRK